MNLVFAHGLFGFRKKLAFEYFRDVKEHFSSSSTHVLVTEVSPAASIQHRGEELRSQILDAFKNRTLDPAEKAHIIGHSMGGLDARFILSKANPNNISSRIASLTTIGTPHRGSFVANLVAHIGVRRLSLLERVEAALGRAVKEALDFAGIDVDDIKEKLDALDISLEGIANLTTDFMEQFNRNHPNNDDVQYFSAAGGGRLDPGHETGLLLHPFYRYIQFHTRRPQDGQPEPNDGLVHLSSAQWGKFDPDLWPADHADEIGLNLDDPVHPHFDHLARYDQIVKQATAA